MCLFEMDNKALIYQNCCLAYCLHDFTPAKNEIFSDRSAFIIVSVTVLVV